jgi:4'-phosphopantetheinyl transferase
MRCSAVVSAGPVSRVDVQVPFPVRDAMIRRCCGEPARLGPLRDLEFAWIWSVQEACVKATGAGISGRPWTVPVQVGQTVGRWESLRWRAFRDGWPVPVSCAAGSGSVALDLT